MKKLAAIAFAVATLSACGQPAAGEDDDDTWTVIVDPKTGQSFSCFTIWRGGGYSGGPAMWCHEVTP